MLAIAVKPRFCARTKRIANRRAYTCIFQAVAEAAEPDCLTILVTRPPHSGSEKGNRLDDGDRTGDEDEENACSQDKDRTRRGCAHGGGEAQGLWEARWPRAVLCRAQE